MVTPFAGVEIAQNEHDLHSYNGASYHARAICDSEIVTLIAVSSRASRPNVPARAVWAS